MVKKGLGVGAVLVLMMAGCGGGGGSDEAVSANPPAPSPAPTPAPAPPVAPKPGDPIAIVPPTETPPIDPNPPAPTPPGIPAGATLPTGNNSQGFFFLTTTETLYRWNVGSGGWEVAAQQPPPPPPPAAPPEPAPGTYVLGKVVKAAMQSNPFNLGNCNQQYYYYSYRPSCDTTAYEAVGGKADRTKQGVHVGFWLGATYLSHYSYPVSYEYNNPNPKYPHASTSFQIVYPNSILALGKTVTTYSDSVEKPLVRKEGDFEIKDELKFLLDTSAATWYGVEGEPYFLQLQISTFSASSTVFKMCLHQYFPGVRRLACTLHNKDSGEYMGTQVLDDSRSLGVTEYLPPND